MFVDDGNIQTEQDFQDLIASLYDLFDKILIKKFATRCWCKNY